jgi:predicted deacylase
MTVFNVLKATFGIGALTAGAWTMAGTFAETGSVDAVLNGKVTIVRAPADGYFVPLATPLGVVHAGAEIASLKPVPDSGQTGVQWTIQAKSEIDSLKSQIATLQSMSNDLRSQAGVYRQVRLKKIEADLGAERENVAALEARARQAKTVLSRDRRYYDRGGAGGATVQSDRLGESAATLEWQAAKERLEGKQAELAAADGNAFVDDGYNSASYSQQRADQIDLQLIGLKADLMRREGVMAALNDARNSVGDSNKLPAATIAAPTTGLLWKVSGAKDQFVRAGEEVAEIVDCSHFISAVTVADRAYGELGAGQHVTFVAEDHTKAWSGEVVWAGAAEGDVAAALNLAVRPTVSASVRYAFVALLDRAPDDNDACPIGKRGNLFFDGLHDASSGIADALKMVSTKIGGVFGKTDDRLARN